MKALVAVDGSKGSFEAVSQVGGLLSQGKDQVALYYSPPEVRLSSSPVDIELRDKARHALSQQIFTESRLTLPQSLQNGVHTIEGTQDPRRGIPIAAEQWSADLIVVGARGLGQLQRLLLGSVSRTVVHTAKVPIWVARPKGSSAEQTFRVLLAAESPQAGRPAAELLGKFTWPRGASCRALTVVSSLFAGRVPEWLVQQARTAEFEAVAQQWAREHDQTVRDNLASMREFSRSLPPGLQSSEPLVAEGDPAEQILAAISAGKADLVVIGVKHRHSFADAIFGSTSEAVLDHAGCSVLLVPHPEVP
jgi:nucleotide-binding universal stress UspA family protein